MNDFDRDPINRILQRYPRVQLYQEFSPVVPLRNLQRRLSADIDIWIKRDDMLLPFFGNKLRYLEFVLGAYEHSGCDCIVYGGGAKSNYLGQLALIGAARNIEIHLAVSGSKPELPPPNPAVAALAGATIYYTDIDPKLIGNSASKSVIARQLVDKGRQPFVLDYPFSNYSAYLGYMACMREIAMQSADLGRRFTHVVLCSGWHSYLGLRLGADLVCPSLSIVGFRPSARGNTWLGLKYPNFDKFLHDKIREFSAFIGQSLAMPEFDLSEEAVGRGYGQVDNDTLEAISLLASTEGILLDPVYTGKAFAGFLARLRRGFFPKESTVLFIHTGGIMNLFSTSAELALHINSKPNPN